MEKQPKKITLKFSVSKKIFLTLSIIVVLLLSVLFLYTHGDLTRWGQRFNRASVVVTIKNIENQEILTNAFFKINDFTVKSDKDGKVVIDNLTAGEEVIMVTKDGFKDHKSTLTLLRGENKLPDILMTVRPLEEVTFTGNLIDKISQLPITEATISLDTLSTKSDSQGNFTIESITIGKHHLTLNKAGFTEFKQEVEITKEKSANNFTLIPEKKIYFISNRDGKRGIYSSDLSGNSPMRVVPASELGEEDELYIAPNYQYAIFTSFRDGVKDDNGNKLKLGYFLDFSNNSFNRISTDRYPFNIVWSQDSKNVAYEAQKDESGQNRRNVVSVYNATKKENRILYEAFGSTIGKNFVQSDKLLVSLSQWGNQNSPSTPNGLVLFNLADGANSQVILDSPYSFQEDLPNNKLYFRISRDNLKYEYNMEKLEIKEIKEIPDKLQNYSYSADGRNMIYIDTRDGKTDIYLKLAKGGDEKKITASGTVAQSQWLDNNLVIYIDSKAGETALYAVSINGGQAQKITDASMPNTGSSPYGEY